MGVVNVCQSADGALMIEEWPTSGPCQHVLRHRDARVAALFSTCSHPCALCTSHTTVRSDHSAHCVVAVLDLSFMSLVW